MEKPINVIIDDVKNDIYKVLMRDNLPITIYAMLLEQINNDVQRQCKIVLENERKQYENALKENNKQSNKEEKNIKEKK